MTRLNVLQQKFTQQITGKYCYCVGKHIFCGPNMRTMQLENLTRQS